MKAVSPLIAVVLLIALTIGVAGILSLFVTGVTKTSTGLTSNQSETVTRCSGVSLNVYRVTNTTVFYSNPSTQNITNIIIVFSDGSQNGCSSGNVIIPGGSNFTTVGNTTCGATGIVPGGATGNTSVTVRGLCQSTFPVEGTCKQGQSCWAT